MKRREAGRLDQVELAMIVFEEGTDFRDGVEDGIGNQVSHLVHPRLEKLEQGGDHALDSDVHRHRNFFILEPILNQRNRFVKNRSLLWIDSAYFRPHLLVPHSAESVSRHLRTEIPLRLNR